MATTIFMGKATKEQTDDLRAAYAVWLEADGSGDFPMAEFTLVSGLNYSRAWQIARRWYLEERMPEALVDAGALIKAWQENHEGWMPNKGESYEGEALAPTIRTLREAGHSWGELNVRFGMPEGRLRQLFTYKSTVKDRGLRIGRGGRFVTDDPRLYQENMKREGAMIPADFKGHLKPEICLNYKADAAKRAKKAAAAAKAKATREAKKATKQAEVAVA